MLETVMLRIDEDSGEIFTNKKSILWEHVSGLGEDTQISKLAGRSVVVVDLIMGESIVVLEEYEDLVSRWKMVKMADDDGIPKS